MNNPAGIIAPGHNRTYAKFARLAIPDLLEAYRAGRTVVTNGPLLVFTVDGRQPGDVIRLPGDGRQRLRLRAEAHGVSGIERVEVLQNGRVVKTIEPNGRQQAEAAFELEVAETCWLAARCTGKKSPWFGTFAHTSPTYVQCGQMPMRPKPEDVDFFLKWLEGYREAIAEYARRNNIPEAEYAELGTHLQAAAHVYRGLIGSPRRWTQTP